MRNKLTVVVATSLMGVLAACGSSGGGGGSTHASSQGSIKVGGLLDKTGVAAPNGIAALQGATLAIDEANAAGGINGRKIQFSEQDPAFDVGQATALLQRFVSDKNVVAVIGPNSDTVSTPMTETFNRDQIVSLVTSGAGGRPNSAFGKYMFSIPVRNDFLINKVTAALRDHKLTHVAVVYSTSRPFAASARDFFVADAQKDGLQIEGSPIGYADTDIDFTSIITKIKSTNGVQAVFCSCLSTAAGPMMLQAKHAGLNVRWVSDASLLEPSFYKLSQGAAEGTIVATPFDPSQNAQAKDFVDKFTAKYGKAPNVYNAYGYDSALVLINALRNIKGSITRQSVRDAIASVSFDGATGKIQFPDGQGVASRADAYVVEMKGGQFVPLS